MHGNDSEGEAGIFDGLRNPPEPVYGDGKRKVAAVISSSTSDEETRHSQCFVRKALVPSKLLAPAVSLTRQFGELHVGLLCDIRFSGPFCGVADPVEAIASIRRNLQTSTAAR